MIDLSQLYNKEPGTVNVVYDYVREKILNWEYKPGYQMSEQKLSDELGVSRTPVREAFIKLVAEGLMETRPYRGTFVTKIDLRSVEEVRFIRNCLEKEVAKLACELDVQDYLEYAEENIRCQREALHKKDFREFVKLDDQMHEQLFIVCGKQLSWQTIVMISSNYQRLRHVLLDKPILPDEHKVIIDAIAAHDIESAVKAVDNHLSLITSEFADVKRAHPDYFLPE